MRSSIQRLRPAEKSQEITPYNLDGRVLLSVSIDLLAAMRGPPASAMEMTDSTDRLAW